MLDIYLKLSSIEQGITKDFNAWSLRVKGMTFTYSLQDFVEFLLLNELGLEFAKQVTLFHENITQARKIVDTIQFSHKED